MQLWLPYWTADREQFHDHREFCWLALLLDGPHGNVTSPIIQSLPKLALGRVLFREDILFPEMVFLSHGVCQKYVMNKILSDQNLQVIYLLF